MLGRKSKNLLTGSQPGAYKVGAWFAARYKRVNVYNLASNSQGKGLMSAAEQQIQEDRLFLEFRRKVRDSEVLSAAVERLIGSLHFSGRVTVVVQNGRVLKSGYEEGYFRRRADVRLQP